MKTISDALRDHLAGERQTMATCWLAKRTDGTILGFTDFDRDIIFDLDGALSDVGLSAWPGVAGAGAVVYASATGITASTVQTGQGLNVDTGEAVGVLTSPAITEVDLRAGLWDHCAIAVFQVNWDDLTMGALLLRVGHIGEVTTDNGFFRAEWRGLTQAYQATIGELTSPYCGAVLGDSRCTVALGAFTVTGTLDAVSADNLTMIDAARNEAGPATPLTITSITNANPGIVTVNDGSGLANGDAVMLSGNVCAELQGTTFVRNLSGNSFSLGMDTSDTAIYDPYTSGGKVTPLGAASGYFDGGLMTFTSGENDGMAVEVKAYVPGQWTLCLPPSYPVTVGTTYSMVAGCDKSRNTCRDRFSNILNFRGFPFVPGNDAIMQVGRQG